MKPNPYIKFTTKVRNGKMPSRFRLSSNIAEQLVILAHEAQGYIVVTNDEFNALSKQDKENNKYLVSQYEGNYSSAGSQNGKGRLDFYDAYRSIGIEVKSQWTEGTAYQKADFALNNAMEQSFDMVLLIAESDYYNEQRIVRLVNNCEKSSFKKNNTLVTGTRKYFEKHLSMKKEYIEGFIFSSYSLLQGYNTWKHRREKKGIKPKQPNSLTTIEKHVSNYIKNLKLPFLLA